MKKSIERLAELRSMMEKNGIEIYIVPSGDPHQSEYVADYWKAIEFLTGFTGDAGVVVISQEKAILWTDSRYFIQAEAELAGSSVELFKMGVEGVPTFSKWIADEIGDNGVVGFDGKALSVTVAKNIETALKSKKITINSSYDFIAEIWKDDRPALPMSKLFTYDVKYAGKSRSEKLDEIREKMRKLGVEFHLISSLDDIAWILNIRGEDVHCNPVIISYLLIGKDNLIFFVDKDKISVEYFGELADNEIEIRPYKNIEVYLSENKINSILLDYRKTNKRLYDILAKESQIVEGQNISELMKAIKNDTEIELAKETHIKDGVAMVKWLCWLEKNVTQMKLTEMSAADKLEGFRSEQKDFMGISFDSIAGYGSHGALPHYFVTKESASDLENKGLFLMDSGAQYLGGTTDITRTIALGKLTDEEMKDYTLVLKGHINLAKVRFPKGTKGCNVDILARLPLLESGFNYLHGTGHGIGSFLNVHEGPQSLSPSPLAQDLKVGMLSTNEPGVYREGKHGVRIENVILTIHDEKTEFGEFLKFETITMCPIDKKPILIDLMTECEKKWLNDYHKIVFEKVSPFLNDEEKVWLEEATKEI